MRDARHASEDSDVSSNATALNRRSSIHSASTRVNVTPPTRHSTLEIEIEYIRTTSAPIAKVPSVTKPVVTVTQIPERPGVMHAVAEEEEEEDDEELGEDALARNLGTIHIDSNDPSLTRRYPAHPRPQSLGYYQGQPQNPRRALMPSWEQNLYRGGPSRPAIHSVQSAITHSVDLTSSHVQHSTPDLSTTGSQSEDEDELDEVPSPVELIEVLELS
ncbi:hypothetical protein BG000_005439, partial [Podila horticola]